MKGKVNFKIVAILLITIVTYIVMYPQIEDTFDLTNKLVILMFMFIAFASIPDKLDRFKRMDAYENHIFCAMLIPFSLFIIEILNAASVPVNEYTILGLVIGGGIMFSSNYLPRIKMNSYAGIRTPWTMKSDLVWRKTHTLSGIAGFITGMLIIILTIFNSEWFVLYTVVLACIWAVFSIVVSFVLYKKSLA